MEKLERNIIIFLDDSHERAALAYQRMTPEAREQTIWCKTVEETVTTLRDYKDVLEIVMLDHDLGGQQFVDPRREDCGMEVIRYLEKYNWKNPEEFESFKNIRFIVHTHNPYAGKQMVERLQKLDIKKVDYRPFGM